MREPRHVSQIFMTTATYRRFSKNKAGYLANVLKKTEDKIRAEAITVKKIFDESILEINPVPKF